MKGTHKDCIIDPSSLLAGLAGEGYTAAVSPEEKGLWQLMLGDLIDRFGQLVWIGIIAIAALVGIVIVFLQVDTGTEPQVINLTLDAAATQQNLYVPTLAANLTRTPENAAATAAVPTLSLSGRQEVRMFAASAQASSEADVLNQAAIQAAGPPNTPECGDYNTAWATKKPTDQGTITLLYPELVTPTGVIIYETYNPGFITRVEFTDLYGEVHVLYEAQPQRREQCPFTLVIVVEDADYKGNRLTVTVDQRTSIGGWNQIDAVELIGIKH